MPHVKMLAEGVRLVAEPTEKFKTGCINVSMALPMDDKMAANALLVYLLKRSCKEYPEFSLLCGKLDELYGAALSASVAKNGEAQMLSLGITCLADKFALDGESIGLEAAELLASLIFKPNCENGSFGEDALAAEKRLLIQRIEEELNDKRTYAFNKCISNMCKNEAFGKPRCGTVEEIENVTMADVYAAWENLIKTAVFQITVVGAADADKIASIFAGCFENVERKPAEIETVFIQRARRLNHSEEKLPVNQGKLVIGFRAGTHNRLDNIHAVTVMNDIFGMGTYSKLFMNVREKLSLAYYCWSRLVASKGIILVESGIDTDKEKKVTAEVLSQLTDLRNGKTDPEVLESSKRALREKHTFSSPESFVGWYSSQVLADEIMTPEEMVKGIEEVTMEQVCEAAKKISIDTIFMLSAQEEAENEV